MSSLPEHRNNLKIVTRDGAFHVGQVFAFATLALAYNGHRLHLVRSSDPDELSDADIVFDAGGRYDPQQRRFDHDPKHRLSDKDGFPRGGLGLIWQHLGLLAVSSACPETALPMAVAIWRHVDINLVRPTDLSCNGIPGCPHGSVAGVLKDISLLWFNQASTDDVFLHAAGLADMLLRHAVTTISCELASGQPADPLHMSGYARPSECRKNRTRVRSCRPGVTRVAHASA